MAKPAKSKSLAPKTPPARPSFFRRNAFNLALVLITFLVFGNSISNEYALDDEFYTAGSNKLTQKGFKGIPTIFSSRTFYNNDGTGYSYRPVAVASFAVEIQLFGEHPHISHLINVLLYALTVVLLFRLLRRWFAAQGDWFSFFIALLFLVHPLHTEVVDNIKCRDELLAILGGVSALYFLFRFRENGKWFFAVLYPVCFFLGMLAKATIMPFFLLIPLVLWFFTDLKLSRIAFYVLPLVAMALLSLLIKNTTLPESVREMQVFENPITQDTNFFEKAATAGHVLGRYLWLHFIPHPLVYYYGQNYVPPSSWADPVAIVGALLHIGLGILGFIGFRRKTIWGFGILFYLFNIVFYSNLISPAPGLMAERFAYAASFGFCIVAIWGLFRLLKLAPEAFVWGASNSSRLRLAVIGLTAIFALRSISRNEVWEDKRTLYTNDIEYLGESAKANMLLGSLISADAARLRYEANSYMENGRQNNNANDYRAGVMKRDSSAVMVAQAREYYQQATRIAPRYYTAWSNLGTTYFFAGRFREAVPNFKESLRYKPNYTEGLYNLGVTYDSLKMTDSSLFFLRRCIASDSGYAAAYDPLCKQLVRRDSSAVPQVFALLQRAVANNPKSDAPWMTMASISQQLGDSLSAIRYFEKAAEVMPGNRMRLYQLSMYFQQHNNPEKANYYQNKLIEMQREDAAKNKKRRPRN